VPAAPLPRWLPDSLERIFYFNVISLMLSVLDEVVDGMSMNFAGVGCSLRSGPAACRARRSCCAGCCEAPCWALLSARARPSDPPPARSSSPASRPRPSLACPCPAAATHVPVAARCTAPVPQHNVKLQLTYLDMDPQSASPGQPRQGEVTAVERLLPAT
jgi:hypothetical protein